MQLNDNGRMTWPKHLQHNNATTVRSSEVRASKQESQNIWFWKTSKRRVKVNAQRNPFWLYCSAPLLCCAKWSGLQPPHAWVWGWTEFCCLLNTRYEHLCACALLYFEESTLKRPIQHTWCISWKCGLKLGPDIWLSPRLFKSVILICVV